MITIVNEPSGRPSVQDDLWHIVTSDASGQTDMKYVFDVYVNDQILSRQKFFPEPGNGRGYFNPAPVVQGQITYSWFEPQNEIYLRSPNASGEMSIQYRVEYGEEVSGITTLNMASGTTRAYNWRPPVFKRRVNDLSQLNNKFVTNRPLYANAALGTGEKLLVGVHSLTGVDAIVTKYGYDNVALNAPANASSATNFNEYCQLNLAPEGINGEFGSNFIDAQVKYYIVELDGLGISFRVNIICDREYTPIPIHFINQYGMFDTARFGLVSKLTKDTERKGYKQKDYTLGSTVQYYDQYNTYRESRINHSQRSVWSYKLTMDAPTDAEYQWLAEMLDSPQMYAEIDGYFYPVTIKNTNYEYSTYLNNRLRAFEIDIDINQTRYGHAR